MVMVYCNCDKLVHVILCCIVLIFHSGIYCNVHVHVLLCIVVMLMFCSGINVLYQNLTVVVVYVGRGLHALRFRHTGVKTMYCGGGGGGG